MTREEIQTRITAIAAEQADMPVEQVTPASDFINDLHYDSLQVVEFAMEVEDELELSIPDEDVERLRTVGDVINYVVEHQSDPARMSSGNS